MSLIKPMVSSKTNEWITPQWLFDELNDEFHFTLDPCATDDNHKCINYYTIENDGLKKIWGDNIVFMNPPYGGNTKQWIEKAYYESRLNSVVVCLLVSSTDRSYWHDFIFPFASQIRFIRGRLKFSKSISTAPFASAVVIFDRTKKYDSKILYYNESVSKKRMNNK